jgi:K+ transporter
LLILGVLLLIDEDVPFAGGLILLIVMWGTAFFIMWMWQTTAYILENEHLLIRYGPFRHNIPYSNIRKVKRTVNFLSSAALSTKRLEIHYNRFDLIYISPEEEERFLSLLRERCPEASFED